MTSGFAGSKVDQRGEAVARGRLGHGRLLRQAIDHGGDDRIGEIQHDARGQIGADGHDRRAPQFGVVIELRQIDGLGRGGHGRRRAP